MKASDFIEALKQFFFDVLGFFLPGLLLIYLLSLYVNPTVLQYKSIASYSQDWYNMIVIVAAYALGYVVYGLAELYDLISARIWKPDDKDKLKLNEYNEKCKAYTKDQEKPKNERELKDFRPRNKVKELLMALCLIQNKERLEVQVTTSQTFRDSVDKINALREKNHVSGKLDYAKMREVRSIVMSYIPEADDKIYDFMFRAEISRHLSAACLTIVLLGGINWGLSKAEWPTFFDIPSNIGELHFGLLLFAAYFLHITRIRFLGITYRIPFSIFMAKKIDNE